jgi:hypothetical protein
MAPESPFAIGDRVRISDSASWACGAAGRIGLPPPSLLEAMEIAQDITGAQNHGWVGASSRSVRNGREVVEWWVTFDKPQVDEDGDGPMAGGSFLPELIDRET